jgi:hypothetical protein
MPVCASTTRSSLRLRDSFACAGVQEEDVVGAFLREVEFALGSGNGVEGALPNALSGKPVVFNEVDDGTLVGDGGQRNSALPMER